MKKNVGFGITLIRGLFAVTLGVLLLFQPDKTRPILGNFMGMFWLASGVISLRWGASGERARGVAILAGVIGILGGLGMLGRFMISGYVREDVVFPLVGLIMLLTGLIHIFGGFRTGEGAHRQWSLTSFLLGLFEVVLGAMLIVNPYGRGTFFYMAASIWALVGGFILISDAIRLRRAAQESQDLVDARLEQVGPGPGDFE